MKNPFKTEDDFLITFTDLFRILWKEKNKIFIGATLFSLLTLSYALQRPVSYHVEATFREKGNTTAGMSTSTLAAMFFSGSSGGGSAAVTTMKSRKLLERVIRKLGLQASIGRQERSFPRLRRIRDNLVVEWTLFRKKPTPALADIPVILRAKEVIFEGEIPLSVGLTFISHDVYEVTNHKNELIGVGHIGSPFKASDYQFTLENVDEAPLKGQIFGMSFSPLADVAKGLGVGIKIETDREDSSLLNLSYGHRDRQLATEILNEVMLAFQDYLRDEQHRVSSEQISYLKRREGEIGAQLKTEMDDYAKKLSTEVSNYGFTETEKALEFLAQEQQLYEQKTMAIDLEIKRLQMMQEGKYVFDDSYHSEDGSPTIKELIHEIRDYNQQSDSIEVALRNSPLNYPNKLKESFEEQIVALDDVKKCNREATVLLASLDRDHLPKPAKNLFSQPNNLTKVWYDRLQTTKKGTSEWVKCKEQYSNYLTNLQHFLHVQEKTIEERLAHQQGRQQKFQGINLKTANDLYITYSKQQSDVEGQIAERKFIIAQMEDPEFEISSLCTVLNDSVSLNMINHASELVLAIQDDSNRSAIEKERLKKELALQRKFLRLHLDQTLQLLALRENLLHEKVYSIQSTMLELIQQQISILEKQLSDYIETHVANLHQERELIEQHQNGLRQEMAKLPKKWVKENFIKQHLKMNERMVEEVTKLVESKNIAKNLEMVQSAPLDGAIPPIQPRRPRLLFFTIVGAILGSLFMMSWVIGMAIIRGVPASKESLELSQMHISGPLIPKDQNLGTLRRLIHFLSGQSLLILKGQTEDYSCNVATLLAKQGLKVVVLPLTFEGGSEEQGLLQYLEGKEEKPKIIQGQTFDRISAGGFTPFGNELIASRRFEKLIDRLKEQYDWVIAVSSESPKTPEVEGLIRHFDNTAITIQDETLQELSPIISMAKEESAKVSFLFVRVLG